MKVLNILGYMCFCLLQYIVDPRPIFFRFVSIHFYKYNKFHLNVTFDSSFKWLQTCSQAYLYNRETKFLSNLGEFRSKYNLSGRKRN